MGKKSELVIFLTPPSLFPAYLGTHGKVMGRVLGGCRQEMAEGGGLAQPGSHHME